MPLNDDGDLIRALGYVALYAAYLEEAIDDVLLAVCSVNKDADRKKLRWPVSRKIDFIHQSMEDWNNLSTELSRFTNIIVMLSELLERRNFYIHGRIYADRKSGDILKPAREGYPEIPAMSSDLYSLANDLFGARSLCQHTSEFAIPRYANSQSQLPKETL